MSMVFGWCVDKLVKSGSCACKRCLNVLKWLAMTGNDGLWLEDFNRVQRLSDFVKCGHALQFGKHHAKSVVP